MPFGTSRRLVPAKSDNDDEERKTRNALALSEVPCGRDFLGALDGLDQRHRQNVKTLQTASTSKEDDVRPILIMSNEKISEVQLLR